MSAGLEHARGEAVVIIDADLQDPPEVIPEFVREWRNGYDVVYGRRSGQRGRKLVEEAHCVWVLSLDPSGEPGQDPGGYWRFPFA
ncbi:MAG: glycosyltransferase [Gammaproteobacteria bacterium]